MSTALFLQVRLDSSRLPVKALYELSGKPVIVHCMEALRGLPADHRYLLSDEFGARCLGPFASAAGFEVFAGSKEDVLERFVKAAEHVGADTILRATGDNPLVSREASQAVFDAYKTGEADYCVMTGLPHGGCIEAVSVAALAEVYRNSTDIFEHEHVCPGVYRNPQKYKVLRIPAPEHLRGDDLSVTLDTPADYRQLRRLFEVLYKGSPIELPLAIAYLRGALAVDIEKTLRKTK